MIFGLVALLATTAPAAATAHVELQQPQTCIAPSTDGTEIVVLSTDGSGGSLLPFQIAQSPSHLVSVTGAGGGPVTLVLLSGGPTVWDLRGISAGRVKSVIASGRDVQGVIGLPASVPIQFDQGRVLSMDDGSSSCPPIPATQDIGGTIRTATAVRTRFGRYPDHLYAGQRAGAFDVDGGTPTLPAKVDVNTSDIRTATPIGSSPPVPYVFQVRKLIDDGTVKPLDPQTINMIRSAGMQITPAAATARQVQPDEAARLAGMPPEQRKRILDGRARAAAEIPPFGLLATKTFTMPLPANGDRPDMEMGVFYPSDVPVPQTAPAGGMRYYRIAGTTAEVAAIASRTPSINGSPIDRMFSTTAVSGPITVTASWKGNDMVVPMPSPTGIDAAQVHSNAPPPVAPERSYPWLALGISLVVLAALAGLAFRFRDRIVELVRPKTKPAMGKPAAAKAAQAKPKPKAPIAEEAGFEAVLDRLDKTSVPTVVAASIDFRKKTDRLAARDDLEDDLATRADDVCDNQLRGIALRYLKARPSADGDVAAGLDAKMVETLVSLGVRIDELGAEQDRRNIDAMRIRTPE